MDLNVGFALQFWPQLQSMIAEVLQSVVAAYQVYGLNAAIWDEVSGTMSSCQRRRHEGGLVAIDAIGSDRG